MLGRSQEVVCDRCEEHLLVEIDPEVADDLTVYGDVIVRDFGDHIRLEKDDWNKYKQRLIPVLKQGDRKHGSTDTEASKVGIAESSPASRQSDDSGSSHW